MLIRKLTNMANNFIHCKLRIILSYLFNLTFLRIMLGPSLSISTPNFIRHFIKLIKIELWTKLLQA